MKAVECMGIIPKSRIDTGEYELLIKFVDCSTKMSYYIACEFEMRWNEWKRADFLSLTGW